MFYSCIHFCIPETGFALIFGTFIKFSIIRYLRQRGRRSTATIIQLDELVLFEQTVNIVNAPLIIMNLLHLSIPAYTEQIFENLVCCSVWYMLFMFTTFHRTIGGLGIAGVRVLCIRFPFSVLRIGAKRLVKCTCRMTFMLSFLFAVGSNIEITVIDPEIIIIFFKEARFVDSKVITNFFSKEIFNNFIGTSCLMFNVAELICFIIIFVEMCKQHKKHVKLCLLNKPEMAKMKKRRNTISAVGHFVSWSVEVLMFAFGMYIREASKETRILNAWNLFYFRLLVPSINYVVFPTVQALTSKELRNHVFSLTCCREIFLKFYYKFKKDGNDTEGGVAKGIELHTIESGKASRTGSNNGSVNNLFEDRTKSCTYPSSSSSPLVRDRLTRSFSL